MLAIICLVIGIIGFVKGKVNVSKHKELRGKWMYIVCTLLCLPLPLSFLAGIVMGAMAVSSGSALDETSANVVGIIVSIVPLLAALVLAFTMAQPKTEDPAARGFDVNMPPPPPSSK